jgi:SAM-dependent methyltransferase
LSSFDRVAGIYDATRGLPPQAAAQVADGLARIFREAAPRPRVLEPGVGTGRMAVPLAERGLRVTGIDLSRRMLAVLREKRPALPTALALADALPFPDAAFDGVLLVHLLHLVPDAAATLGEACRVVRPGGIALSGGEAAPSGLMRDVSAAMREASAAAGIELGLWDRFRIGLEVGEAALAARGAACRSELLASWSEPQSARRLLERLAKRVNSQTWSLSDAQLAALVERLTPAVERLCGGLDRVHEIERGFRVLVGRLPEAVTTTDPSRRTE